MPTRRRALKILIAHLNRADDNMWRIERGLIVATPTAKRRAELKRLAAAILEPRGAH